MMTQLQIRDHLVPFFFKEFGGNEKYFDSEVSKIVTINTSSSLFNYLKNTIDFRQKTNIFFYLSIDKIKPFKMKGLVFFEEKNVKKPLMLQEEQVESINGFLEDLFRSTLVFYIKAYQELGFLKELAIKNFMENYELLEYGFEYNTLKMVFYRNPNLKRFLNQNSNRINKTI